ncbi:hypothetical protein L0156_15360 [bacterium]|nr:hypothetical protein [bacterium]
MSPKVVFLPPAWPVAHQKAGCPIAGFQGLEKFAKEQLGDAYVSFDLLRLHNAGIGTYYIYDRKHCKLIGSVLGANTFVMIQVRPGSQGDRFCDTELYNFEGKVYSAIADEKKILFHFKDFTSVQAESELSRIRKQCFLTILAAARKITGKN